VYGISGPAFAVVGILALAADLGLKETFGKFLPEVGLPARARYIFRRFVFVCLASLQEPAARRQSPCRPHQDSS